MQDFFANCATVLQKYGFSYLRGAGTTLLLALVGTFFGCLIGFAVGALQTIPVDKQRDPVWKRVLLKILHIFLRCYVELFRGTPMIVQAVFIYYGLLQVFGIKMGMWQAGFFIVSINTGAYMAETVRGGIVSIDPGQTEGAKAIGMNHWQTMIHVILPEAHPADRQQLHHQHQGYVGSVRYLHHRPVLCTQKRCRRTVHLL